MRGCVLSRPTGGISNLIFAHALRLTEAGKSYSEVYRSILDILPAQSQTTVVKRGGYDSLVRGPGDGRLQFEFYQTYREVLLTPTAGLLLWMQVDGESRKQGVAQTMLTATLDHYGALGFRFAFAFGRVVGLREAAQDPETGARILQDYLKEARRPDGLHKDHTLRVHERAGGVVVCGIPYVAYDPESLHHGALVVYDLQRVEARRLEEELRVARLEMGK